MFTKSVWRNPCQLGANHSGSSLLLVALLSKDLGCEENRKPQQSSGSGSGKRTSANHFCRHVSTLPQNLSASDWPCQPSPHPQTGPTPLNPYNLWRTDMVLVASRRSNNIVCLYFNDSVRFFTCESQSSDCQ